MSEPEVTPDAIPEERPVWPLEPGRAIAIPVALRDVLPWTKESCKTCIGRGVVTTLVGPERKRSTKLCGCAIKRFRKAQTCTVQNGQLFAVEPWVAVSPETVAEVVEAMEKEQAEKAAAAADQTVVPEVVDAAPRDP